MILNTPMRMWRTMSLRGVGLMAMLLLAACNINQPNQTPTVEILISPTASATRTETPPATLTPSATASPVINMETPILIVTAPPNNVPNMPTAPAATQPLETPTPWSYTIEEGDTLAGILGIQPWNYNGFDPEILRAVVQLNEMFSPDILPPPGATLLIPQRTWTPIPEGANMTETAVAQMGGSAAGSLFVAPGTIFDCYNVQSGDTILGIREQFNTTLELLSNLNPNLNWGGCVFTEPNGGPNCGPFITPNQCVRVPLPTPTVAPSATFTGSETPTATPTRPAAALVYPPDGAIIPGGTFTLYWVSAGILAADQVYLVEVQDVTAASAPWQQITRDTFMDLPSELVPSDGQTHQFQWRVTVVKRNEGGTYAMSDGQGPWRPFQWHSR